MKLIARLVEVIGDDEWVDQTIRRSVEGVQVIVPGHRLLRSTLVGMTEITESELAKLEQEAGPERPDRPSPVRVEGDPE